MDWGSLLGQAAAIGSGGLLGIVGSLFGAAGKYLTEKQRQEFEIKKWEHETKLLELQMEAKKVETEMELALVSQTGSWEGLTSSIQADQSVAGVHAFVNDLRALFRPFLTILLWAIGGWVFYEIVSNDGFLLKWINEMEIKDLIRYMVYSIFFCASTATTWWFGDRALTPPGMKNR